MNTPHTNKLLPRTIIDLLKANLELRTKLLADCLDDDQAEAIGRSINSRQAVQAVLHQLSQVSLAP